MVRRQTMQIEAEKRAVLRLALIVVTVLFAISLLLSGLMYRSYSSADGKVRAAEDRARELDTKFQSASRELAEKKAILEKNAANLAKQNTVIESIVPKMLSRTVRDIEMAELAHAIFQQPEHWIPLAAIPPNNVLRRYRIRVDGRLHSYVLVAGMVDGRWVLYSNLLKNEN